VAVDPKDPLGWKAIAAGLAAKKAAQAKAAAGAKAAAAAKPAAGQRPMTNLLNTFGVSYPNAPQPTPALLAYLRGVGLSLSTAEDVKRRAIERIGAATSDAMSDIDRTAGRTKQNVTADLVRRGVLVSGESNTRYARHAEDVGAQRADVLRSKAEQSETAEMGYRSAKDAARQAALERVIGVEQEQAVQKATSAAETRGYQRQESAADKAWAREKAAQEAALTRQEKLMREYAQKGVLV